MALKSKQNHLVPSFLSSDRFALKFLAFPVSKDLVNTKIVVQKKLSQMKVKR